MMNQWLPAAALLGLAALSQAAAAAGGGVAIAVGPKHPAAAAALLGSSVTVAPAVLKGQADFGVIAARMGRQDGNAGSAGKVNAGPGDAGVKAPRSTAGDGG